MGDSNSKNEPELFERLERAICKTVSEFKENPIDFLSERDIQSFLFSKLRDEMNDLRCTAEAKDIGSHFEIAQNINFNLVKTEYQLYAAGSGSRVDVAVLSDVQGSNLWRQPCRVAIEIKLWQPGHCLSPLGDINKLESYWRWSRQRERLFAGIAMLFVHPFAQRWLKTKPEVEKLLENWRWLKGSSGVEVRADFALDGVMFYQIEQSTHEFWQLLSPVGTDDNKLGDSHIQAHLLDESSSRRPQLPEKIGALESYTEHEPE